MRRESLNLQAKVTGGGGPGGPRKHGGERLQTLPWGLASPLPALLGAGSRCLFSFF